jgi:hypothetical protein
MYFIQTGGHKELYVTATFFIFIQSFQSLETFDGY